VDNQSTWPCRRRLGPKPFSKPVEDCAERPSALRVDAGRLFDLCLGAANVVADKDGHKRHCGQHVVQDARANRATALSGPEQPPCGILASESPFGPDPMVSVFLLRSSSRFIEAASSIAPDALAGQRPCGILANKCFRARPQVATRARHLEPRRLSRPSRYLTTPARCPCKESPIVSKSLLALIRLSSARAPPAAAGPQLMRSLSQRPRRAHRDRPYGEPRGFA
jgi:hypothetical protein